MKAAIIFIALSLLISSLALLILPCPITDSKNRSCCSNRIPATFCPSNFKSKGEGKNQGCQEEGITRLLGIDRVTLHRTIKRYNLTEDTPMLKRCA
jgi:hypothetical protein